MAIEDRTGVCATCDGPIYRYPNPNPEMADSWAHRNRVDVFGDKTADPPIPPNPHEATPKEPTE